MTPARRRRIGRAAIRSVAALAVLLASAVPSCAQPVEAPRRVPFSALAGAPSSPPDTTIAWGDAPQQHGELRMPAGTARVPVVVLVHGGCWRAAYDRTHLAAMATALAREGLATWTIEYRRVGDAGGGWPGTFDDVARAVDHVRILAAAYPRLDTTRVVLAGHSAGGQLALWAASRRANETPGGATPLRAHGVVALAPITDLARYASAQGCGSAVVPLMGGDTATVAARYAQASPVARVPLRVPVTIVHGAADPTVPLAQAEALVTRAAAAGERIVLDVVPDAGHFDVVLPGSVAWPAVTRAIRAALGEPR